MDQIIKISNNKIKNKINKNLKDNHLLHNRKINRITIQ
jgi:hypothetical protein